MECRFCKGRCIKKGKRNRIQRFQCKECFRYQQQEYVKAIIPEEQYEWVKQPNNEDCGISSISRLLKISKSSVQRLIERIASVLKLMKFPPASSYRHRTWSYLNGNGIRLQPVTSESSPSEPDGEEVVTLTGFSFKTLFK